MPSRALARVGMLRGGEMQACFSDAGVVKAWRTIEWILSQHLIVQGLAFYRKSDLAARLRRECSPAVPVGPRCPMAAVQAVSRSACRCQAAGIQDLSEKYLTPIQRLVSLDTVSGLGAMLGILRPYVGAPLDLGFAATAFLGER